MPMAARGTGALMAAAMMIAMMLPSIAPTLWRCHRGLRAVRTPRAGWWTAVVAAGYAGVWGGIGVALSAASAASFPLNVAGTTDAPFAPWAGVVVLCVGVVQRSQWKAEQLRRCRHAGVAARATRISLVTAWRDGCRLGVDCALSCAAPMAVLLVAGLMDARAMVAITTAVTAERVAPDGARIARVTGALAVVAGVAMFVRAMGGGMA